MNATRLVSLVEHLEAVDAEASLERVVRRFQRHGQHYMAVLDGESYLGLLSDAQVGTMLGSRYGFSLHVRERAKDHLLPEILCAAADWSLLRVLEHALARRGPAFHHDVPLVAADGRFLGILSVQRLVREQARIMTEQMELAERHRLELEAANRQLLAGLEELRQSEGRYVSLFQHSPLGVALVAPDGRVEACNSRLEGWLSSGKQNGEWNLTEGLAPSDLAPFLALIRAVPRIPIVEGEVTLRNPARGPRRFRVHASWIEETGQICAAFQDITEQRALERGMALHEKAALFERMASGIAHELNNKLTPVVGFADLLSLRLEMLPDAHKALGQCRMIRNGAEEAVRMVRQLLQLGRPPQAEMAPCDLNEVVQEAWTIVGFRLKALQVASSLDLAPKGAPVHVDGSQIKQVIVNLVMNAVDAVEQAPRKHIHVKVGTEGSSVTLMVADSGHGIPAENLQRIFDPFFTTKSPDRGTGLGLSVCLGILQQHGGDIQVSSRPGEGSAFTVTLPLAARAEMPVAGTGRMFVRPLVTDRIIRVLVVDDEVPVTELVKETLQAHCGWVVEACNRVDHALERLGRNGFDLVLTDLRMPGLDGFALLSWMKAHRPAMLPRTAIITADAGEADLAAAWGVRLLRKPFSASSLVDTCRSLLPSVPPVLVA